MDYVADQMCGLGGGKILALHGIKWCSATCLCITLLKLYFPEGRRGQCFTSALIYNPVVVLPCCAAQPCLCLSSVPSSTSSRQQTPVA